MLIDILDKITPLQWEIRGFFLFLGDIFLFHLCDPNVFLFQNSMNRMAVQALEKMETRKFKAKGKVSREGSCGGLDTLSSSSTSDCAICLEKYIDGEVI